MNQAERLVRFVVTDIRLNKVAVWRACRASSSMAGELSTPAICAEGQRCFSSAVLCGPQPKSTAEVMSASGTRASNSAAGRVRSALYCR